MQKSKTQRTTTEQHYISALSLDELLDELKNVAQDSTVTELKLTEQSSDLWQFTLLKQESATHRRVLQGEIRRWEGTKTRVTIIKSSRKPYQYQVVLSCLAMLYAVLFCGCRISAILSGYEAFTSQDVVWIAIFVLMLLFMVFSGTSRRGDQHQTDEFYQLLLRARLRLTEIRGKPKHE